jgi:hypothetical protein
MKQEMEKSYNMNSQILENHFIDTQKRIKEYEKEELPGEEIYKIVKTGRKYNSRMQSLHNSMLG